MDSRRPWRRTTGIAIGLIWGTSSSYGTIGELGQHFAFDEYSIDCVTKIVTGNLITVLICLGFLAYRNRSLPPHTRKP